MSGLGFFLVACFLLAAFIGLSTYGADMLGVGTVPMMIAVLATIPLFYGLYRLVRHVKMKKYFAGEVFQAHKADVASLLAEYADVSAYITEINRDNRFELAAAQTAENAHLADFVNTSAYAYQRDRNTYTTGTKKVHPASLQVVRNASMEPIKYFMKYFDIEPTEARLEEVEQLGESLSRLRMAIMNLSKREAEINNRIAPPEFILKHYRQEYLRQIGLKIRTLAVPYPIYKFQYVSAGGNSSQETRITLNSETIDALIEALAAQIKFIKSAAGQRALMTATFREHIKRRDNFTCQICSLSTEIEPNLLLEVDHIQPVSKGGLSVEANLQTLCWRCNRTKSNSWVDQ